MRTISAAGLAALDSGRFGVRGLLKVTLPATDPFCIWDDLGSIVVGGDTYIGAPGRFTIQPATSSYDAGARAVRLILSGLDSAAVALIEGASWHQAPVIVQRAIIATEAPAVLHLFTEFSGYLDQMLPIDQIDGTSTIEFLCETASREGSRSGARTRSDADQRERDSGDGIFSFATSAVTTTIDWGRAPQQPQQRPGGIAGFIDKLF